MVIGNDHPHPHNGKYAPYVEVYGPQGPIYKYKGLLFLSNQGSHLAVVWYGDRYDHLHIHNGKFAPYVEIPFYDKNIKIGFSGFFSCENGFWYYLRVRAAKANVKNSIKGILYDFKKKIKNLIFQFFDENLLSA